MKGVVITGIIVLVLFMGNFWWKSFLIGDNSERENLLAATIFQLIDEGYTKEDVLHFEIQRDVKTGSRIPYEVYVTFKEDPSTAHIYTWSSATEKTEVRRGGYSASSYSELELESK